MKAIIIAAAVCVFASWSSAGVSRDKRYFEIPGVNCYNVTGTKCDNTPNTWACCYATHVCSSEFDGICMRWPVVEEEVLLYGIPNLDYTENDDCSVNILDNGKFVKVLQNPLRVKGTYTESEKCPGNVSV